jgi:hypothetical protein
MSGMNRKKEGEVEFKEKLGRFFGPRAAQKPRSHGLAGLSAPIPRYKAVKADLKNCGAIL